MGGSLVVKVASLSVLLASVDPFGCREGCRSCSSQGVCEECLQGYYLNVQQSCVLCGAHCALCTSQHICGECNATWYGPDCREKCSWCEENKCSKTGCVYGCKETFTRANYKYYNESFGTLCEPCDGKWKHCLTCNPDKCLRCSYRKWGKACSEECTQTCEDQTCSIDTGVCDGECPHGQYRNESGICTLCPDACTACNAAFNCSSCINGRYGPQCNITCNATIPGCHTCSHKNNQLFCSQCHSGFYLSQGNCTECSENCVRISGIVLCHRVTGVCLSGCKPGSWGEDCRNSCNPSCLDGLCDNVTGDCIDCDATHCGAQCDTDCGKDTVQHAGVGGISHRTSGPDPVISDPSTTLNEVWTGTKFLLLVIPVVVVSMCVMCSIYRARKRRLKGIPFIC